MAVPVKNYSAFEEHYSSAAPESGLFGFLIYSSRESHEPVARFAKNHHSFLDELAVNQGMYLYYFVLNKSNALHNPTSFVTKFFGVRLSSLPGFLVFSKANNNRKGLFSPVHVDLFKDTKRVEERLTQLFDMIGDVRAKGKTSDAMIADLTRSLRRWKANEQMRPFWDYAARQSARLVNLPSDIVKKLAEGFARGLVGQPN